MDGPPAGLALRRLLKADVEGKLVAAGTARKASQVLSGETREKHQMKYFWGPTLTHMGAEENWVGAGRTTIFFSMKSHKIS